MDKQVKGVEVLYDVKSRSKWRRKITANKGNSKKLWRTFNSVLGDVNTDETSELSADQFATFFQDKVDSVRSSTESTPLYDVPYRSTPYPRRVDSCHC